MSERIINLPAIPPGTPPELVEWVSAVTQSLELLQGLGRYQEVDRAIRIGELSKLGYDLTDFFLASQESPVGTTPSGKIPLPPTSLTVTVGAWVHTVHMTLPDDQIVSHVEIWVATASQVRDDAKRIYILTVLPDDYGDTVKVNLPIQNVTADYTYWVRSVSFAGNHSPWCPPDSQGGYVVVGSVSVQEAIDRVLEILQDEITESELCTDLLTKITSISGLSDRIASIELDLGSLEVWVSGVANVVDDVRVYADQVYLCILDTVLPHTELPTNVTYWRKIGESATLAGNIAVNSTAISLLDARVEDNGLDVSTNATAVTTVSTQVNHVVTGLPATYAAVQETMESVDGIKAKWAVKTDVNGHVIGIELINDGTIGEFGILADRFKFLMPDGSGSAKQPFTIGDVDGIPTVGIDGNQVIDGSLLVRSIETGNLTVEHLATAQIFKGHTFESTIYETGVSGWRLDANGNLEMPGGSITITGGLDYSQISGPSKPDELVFFWEGEASIELQTDLVGVEWVFNGDKEGGCLIRIEVPDDYAGGIEVSFNGENLTNEVWNNGVIEDVVGQVLNLTEEGETVNLGSLY